MKTRDAVNLKLGKEVIRLTPSFSNLMEVEDRLPGETVFTLLEKFAPVGQDNTPDIKARDLVTVLHCGTGKWDAEEGEVVYEHDFREFGEMCLLHGGIANLITPAIEFLTALLVTMEAKEPVKKPTPKKTTTRKRPVRKSSGKSTSK